jgi:hypothetical protein
MLKERRTLGIDRLHKLVPGLDKGLGALGLQPFGKHTYADSGLLEFTQDQGAFSAIPLRPLRDRGRAPRSAVASRER